MTTSLWLTLGVTVWAVSACVVGLFLGAVVRLRDLPESRGTVGHRVLPVSAWPPPAVDALRSATAAAAVPQRRRPAN